MASVGGENSGFGPRREKLKVCGKWLTFRGGAVKSKEEEVFLVLTTQFVILGGAEGLSAGFAAKLNEDGKTVFLASLYSESVSGLDGPNRYDALPPENHLYLGMRTHPSPFEFLIIAMRLRRLALRLGVRDVETSSVGTSAIAILALWGTSVRHLIGFHCSVTESNRRSSRFRLLAKLMGIRRHERYYGITDFVSKSWQEYAKLDPHRLTVIPNCVRDEFFERPPTGAFCFAALLGIPPNAKVILSIGRLIPEKGVFETLQAVRPLLDASETHLVIVGEPDDSIPDSLSYRQTLLDFVETEGISECVHFLGRRSDVACLLSDSSLLIHVPLHEGFGLVLAEALAMRVPIVASNVDGIPEVLRGARARLVAPKDVPAIRSACKDMLALSIDELEQIVSDSARVAEKYRCKRRTSALLEAMRWK